MLALNQMWEKTERIVKAVKGYDEPGLEKFKKPFHKELKGHLEGEQNIVICMLTAFLNSKNQQSIKQIREKIELKAFELFDSINDLIDLVDNDEMPMDSLLDCVQDAITNDKVLREEDQVLVFAQVINLINVWMKNEEPIVN